MIFYDLNPYIDHYNFIFLKLNSNNKTNQDSTEDNSIKDNDVINDEDNTEKLVNDPEIDKSNETLVKTRVKPLRKARSTSI